MSKQLRLRQWTVIGLYEDNNVYAAWWPGETPLDAMIACARDCPDAIPGGVTIIGAVEGEHTVHTPCDETGCAAAAIDLAELREPEDPSVAEAESWAREIAEEKEERESAEDLPHGNPLPSWML